MDGDVGNPNDEPPQPGCCPRGVRPAAGRHNRVWCGQKHPCPRQRQPLAPPPIQLLLLGFSAEKATNTLPPGLTACACKTTSLRSLCQLTPSSGSLLSLESKHRCTVQIWFWNGMTVRCIRITETLAWKDSQEVTPPPHTLRQGQVYLKAESQVHQWAGTHGPLSKRLHTFSACLTAGGPAGSRKEDWGTGLLQGHCLGWRQSGLDND